MDESRFDDLSRLFARGVPRRRVLAGLAGVALAGLGVGQAGAQTCRAVGGTCREHANCCSGRCGEKDRTGRRRCVCPDPDIPCGGRCVDPSTAFQSDSKNCGNCGNACASTEVCLDGTCVCVDDGTACAGRECGTAVNNCGETVVCTTTCGTNCCDGLTCIIDDSGSPESTCPEGCLGCSAAGPLLIPKCGVDGECCEGSVHPQSFCSETVPCCQTQAGTERACQDGRCCVLDGFYCSGIDQYCCSGHCQDDTCIAA